MRHVPARGIFKSLKRFGVTVIVRPSQCSQHYGYRLAFPAGTDDAIRKRCTDAFRTAFNEELRLAQWCWECGRPLRTEGPRLGAKATHSRKDLDRQFRAVAFRCAWCYQTYCLECGAKHFAVDAPGCKRRQPPLRKRRKKPAGRGTRPKRSPEKPRASGTPR